MMSDHVTVERLREWKEENDQVHPVFSVPHRPERELVFPDKFHRNLDDL